MAPKQRVSCSVSREAYDWMVERRIEFSQLLDKAILNLKAKSEAEATEKAAAKVSAALTGPKLSPEESKAYVEWRTTRTAAREAAPEVRGGGRALAGGDGIGMSLPLWAVLIAFVIFGAWGLANLWAAWRFHRTGKLPPGC